VSHFYGTLQGSRGEATRCGTKKSGVEAWVASWGGAIRVKVWHENGEDRFVVEQRQWHSTGVDRPIARGVIGENPTVTILKGDQCT
jgi:hypothetical protein